jgi:hypothetical protein
VSSFARVALFAGLLALVFAGAALAGSALDPRLDRETSAHAPASEHAMETHSTAREAQANGLTQAEGGLRLVVSDPQEVAASQRLGFRIVDKDGATVRDFEVEHDRRMHLIVVRRDLRGFQHLHPQQAANGDWEVPLRVADAGSYRVFADFSTGGESHTLGTDLHVNGRFEAQALPHPTKTAMTDRGYRARLEQVGGEVRFTVFKGGRRIDDIEPYLGARGHLVALREGDLGFLHVHPESKARVGSDIRFAIEYPSPGRYRLFLQFKLDGQVQTAAFTHEIGDGHGH